jgi:dethiobiotin synthetase
LAPFAAARIEQVKIDIEHIVAALRALQDRVEHVVVEGAGGWLVPIRADYFVSDLAAEMKLPVLVVAQNRLGCLNHTALTVRSIAEHGLPCAGIVLNELPGATDIATATNADILQEIVDVPLLPGLLEDMNELPPSWRQMMDSVGRAGVSWS